MPIISDGYCVCEKCKKKFPWIHFEISSNRMDAGAFIVETPPQGKNLVRCDVVGNKMHYSINCPHCDYENRFYEKDQ